MTLDVRLFDGKLRLTADTHNFIIDVPTGKYDKKDREIFKDASYHKTPEEALQNAATRHIRHSDATALAELAEVIRETHRMIREYLRLPELVD